MFFSRHPSGWLYFFRVNRNIIVSDFLIQWNIVKINEEYKYFNEDKQAIFI
ncbi:MAG: hypothetical protein UV36_C0016G0003 [Parcubacteria group bacterium GW2011_GWC2_42_6]|nr:MAG: hypothetical protein UV36_C0016G0003 [Parcubacteria group bacterium GW2011_GWC2_42_6]